MANKEHLAKLKEGVEAWNQWRAGHLDITEPDLSEANLYGANLGGANLSQAKLRGAELRKANLRSANLTGADLYGANLNGVPLIGADLYGASLCEAKLRGVNLSGIPLRLADLSYADLSRANLTEADLNGADLTKAYLIEANLSRANLIEADLGEANLRGATLHSANLEQARLRETVFSNTDITEVQGLENCRHIEPSTLDHRTLQRSGPLPLAFLRGCGLPDMLIDYLPSLLNQPIQYYSCFISYSHHNEDFAQRLYADLQNHGVRCWYAPEDMKIGDRIRTRLDEVIHVHDKLLLILSVHSVASQWVEKEVETAFEKESQRNETVLFPIRLDEAVDDSQTGWAADVRRSRHIGDFSDWKDHDQYQNAFERLTRDLKSKPLGDT